MGLAPTGYMHVTNERGEKTIVPDPDRAPFIRKLFEMYATGNHSLQTLKEAAIQMGLRTKKREPLAISQINKILKKSFYYGMMDTKYGIVEHCYEPLISQALFQQVQDVINGFHKKPHKTAIKPFIFKGLITCADCGCVVTASKNLYKSIHISF
jgi:site-specific DNA recombinase